MDIIYIVIFSTNNNSGATLLGVAEDRDTAFELLKEDVVDEVSCMLPYQDGESLIEKIIDMTEESKCSLFVQNLSGELNVMINLNKDNPNMFVRIEKWVGTWSIMCVDMKEIQYRDCSSVLTKKTKFVDTLYAILFDDNDVCPRMSNVYDNYKNAYQHLLEHIEYIITVHLPDNKNRKSTVKAVMNHLIKDGKVTMKSQSISGQLDNDTGSGSITVGDYSSIFEIETISITKDEEK